MSEIEYAINEKELYYWVYFQGPWGYGWYLVRPPPGLEEEDLSDEEDTSDEEREEGETS